jgi:hypothetical protein
MNTDNNHIKLGLENFRIFSKYHEFDFVPEGEEQVKTLTIRPDGLMDDDFGEGFFDESTRLIIDLLKIQNRN